MSRYTVLFYSSSPAHIFTLYWPFHKDVEYVQRSTTNISFRIRLARKKIGRNWLIFQSVLMLFIKYSARVGLLSNGTAIVLIYIRNSTRIKWFSTIRFCWNGVENRKGKKRRYMILVAVERIIITTAWFQVHGHEMGKWLYSFDVSYGWILVHFNRDVYQMIWYPIVPKTEPILMKNVLRIKSFRFAVSME